MKIEVTIWDNGLTDVERQEELLFVERAIMNTWRDYHAGERVKITDRSWCGFTATIDRLDTNFWHDSPSTFLSRLMERMNRLHYYNSMVDGDFPINLEIDYNDEGDWA